MPKLDELILYVAKKSEGDQTFGAVKLNKLLYFADFAFYRAQGRSITGEAYIKRAQGPCPKNVQEALESLMASGRAAQQKTHYWGREQTKTVALVDANLSEFSGWEIAIVDEILDQLRDKNATEVSDLSHKGIGWELAEMGEEIPYGTALISFEPLTESEQSAGFAFAQSQGWV